MGCTTSSLTGKDDLKNIDATPSQPLTWLPTKSFSTASTTDPTESALSAEAYTHTIPTMTRSDRGNPSHALESPPKVKDHCHGHGHGIARVIARRASTGREHDPEVTGKPAAEPKVLLAHDFHIGHSKDDVYGSAAHPKPTEPNGKRDRVVPFPSKGKGRPSREEWEAEQMEKARMKIQRAGEGDLGNLGKAAGAERWDDKDEESLAKGLWRRWKDSGKSVGEEYDPVTGLGKHTGMTKEETIEYVGRTRGGGLYSGRQYAYVTAGEGSAGWGV